MDAFINTLLLTYGGLFPIVNPVGSAPLFLGLTQFCSDTQRSVLARSVAINSFFLLLGSMFMGSHVLEFFGISLPVVRIGGGLVVTAFGWKLLNDAPHEGASAAAAANATIPDSFYPLTMPLTVGPGSISVAISLGSARPKVLNFEHLIPLAGAAVAGIVLIVITVYLSYRFAERLVRLLGPVGTNVLMRLSAFIMLCIGIQILWSGWGELTGIAH
jgi:multiple antibiotic resistance protein